MFDRVVITLTNMSLEPKPVGFAKLHSSDYKFLHSFAAPPTDFTIVN